MGSAVLLGIGHSLLALCQNGMYSIILCVYSRHTQTMNLDDVYI